MRKLIVKTLYKEEQWLALDLYSTKEGGGLTQTPLLWYNRDNGTNFISYKTIFCTENNRNPTQEEYEQARSYIKFLESEKGAEYMETNGMREALGSYIKRANAIIKENLALIKLQEELKTKQVALEKKEKDFMQEMQDIGLNSLALSDGTELSIIETYICNVNKNLADQHDVAEWLTEQGQSHMVSSTFEVGEAFRDQLKEHGIAFIEKIQLAHTGTIKAFVKEGLGLTGSHQQFELKDIPKGLKFFIKKEIKVD
jgi:hypothetical protein